MSHGLGTEVSEVSEARFFVGDAVKVVRSLPAGSVDLVLTSPPYLALRSYLPADHPEKDKEMGSEPTPGEFVDSLMVVIEEIRRVLAPHGSLCLDLGDKYSGSGGAGGDYAENGWREGQPEYKAVKSIPRTHGRVGGEQQPEVVRWKGARPGWPLDKSLTMVPELVRITMAYGFNPLTGRETEPWRIRNVVRWCKPNPPVGALADKFRPATNDLLIACVDRSRYFDLDGVRQPYSPNSHPRVAKGAGPRENTRKISPDGNRHTLPIADHDGHGAPPLDWWEVATESYRGAHYATWPRKLLTQPIIAMCPERVCTECGRPSERVTRPRPGSEHEAALGSDMFSEAGRDRTVRQSMGRTRPDGRGNARIVSDLITTQWTDCGHDSWRRGVVLDPFAGSGTTLAVATGLGRDAIGIDLDERNVTLARQRVGMFLTDVARSREGS